MLSGHNRYQDHLGWLTGVHVRVGGIHSTKISGNFGLKTFEKIGSRWNTFLGWTATEMDRSINLSGPFSIPVPRCSVFSMYNMEKNTFFGAGTLTSMSSYSTTVLKLKTIYFSREFELIRQISGNGLLKIMLRMKQLTQYPH